MSPPANERMRTGNKEQPTMVRKECCIREHLGETGISITCRVFPRPMQCASMHPDPDEELAFLTDSQQQSHMNWTPGREQSRGDKNGSQ